VEVLRGRRAVGDAHVGLAGELQEALQPPAGVIRPGALVAVRQQQHERWRLAPFSAGAAQELVDDHLGAVDEIAVLCLPNDQPFWRLDIVAELKAEHGVFGQRTVEDLEGGSRLRDGLQRRERLPAVCIVQHGVALVEGAALGILASEANGDAVFENGRQSQLLRGGPVHRPRRRIGQALAPAIPRPPELGMEVEAIGQAQQRFVQLLQAFQAHRGLDAPCHAGGRRLGLAFGQSFRRVQGFQRGLERVHPVADHRG